MESHVHREPTRPKISKVPVESFPEPGADPPGSAGKWGLGVATLPLVMALGSAVVCFAGLWNSKPVQANVPTRIQRTIEVVVDSSDESWGAPEQVDPALDLLDRVVTSDFDYLDDIATGRFLKHFEEQREILDLSALDEIRPERRGSAWVRLEAPYEPAPDERAKVTEIRLVRRDDGQWKVEHVDVDQARPWIERDSDDDE